MKKIFFFISTLAYLHISTLSFAQSIDLQNAHWELGYKYALDFSSGNMQIDSSNKSIYTGTAKSCISDKQGNLLFYGSGDILDKHGKVLLYDSFYNHGSISNHYLGGGGYP